MRVKDLIESLECYNPDAEVEIVIQPNYPIRCSCDGVTSDADVAHAQVLENGEDGDETDNADERVVYVLVGGDLGYGSKIMWEAERR